MANPLYVCIYACVYIYIYTYILPLYNIHHQAAHVEGQDGVEPAIIIITIQLIIITIHSRNNNSSNNSIHIKHT